MPRFAALIVLFLLAPILAHAQVTFSPTPGTGYLPLDGATVSGSINVRMADCPPGIWKFTIDGMAQPDETVCPIDMGGDNALYDTRQLSNGSHTITAGAPTSTTTVWSAKFAVANSGGTGSGTWSWAPPTKNTDGSVLTDLAGYRLIFGTSSGNLAQSVSIQNAGATSYTLTGLAPATWYGAVIAVNSAGVSSDASNIASATVSGAIIPPPPPPLLTSGTYSYCVTGTANVPTMTAIGYLSANLSCGPAVRQIGSVKFCQIDKSQTDIVGWCPVDKTLAAGIWARAQ